MSFRITCINKSSGNHVNPYVAISHLGWKEDGTSNVGKSTREEMYNFVKDGGKAYVKDAQGNVSILIAATSASGTKYVKTKPDDITSDNLLKLPEC